MSREDVETLRGLYARWEKGDFFTPEAFDPQVEFVRAGSFDDPSALSGSWRGTDAMWGALSEWLQAWEDVHYTAEQFVEVQDRVLVLSRQTARGKATGLTLEREQADVFTLRAGKIVRWAIYWNRSEALADLGLEE